MSKMTVSVVIVVKNGEKYISKAIESVLKQSLSPDEIIVVDGHSTDNTAKIVRSYNGVKHVLQNEKGLAGARNEGIHHAGSDFIAFIDSDDFWPQNKLKMQMDHFKNKPDIQYSYGQVKLFLEQGSVLRNGYDKQMFDRVQKGPTPGTLVARRSLFDVIGKFDPKYNIACDMDWFTRAQDYNIKSHFVSKVLLHKRLHDSNLSSNVTTYKRETFEVIWKSLQRKKHLKKVI